MPTVVDRARDRLGAGGAVVLLVAGAGVAVAITAYARRYGFAGLAVDRAAVRGWLDGTGLYGYRSPDTHLGTAQPPPAAILLTPLAVLPLAVSGWVVSITGVAALVLAMIALAGPVARRYGRRRWPAVFAGTALALAVAPVRAALGLGELDLVLFGLITADVVALRRAAWARSRAAWWPGRPASARRLGRPPEPPLRRAWRNGSWAGVGTGLATAVAVSPALFIAYLAVTRQWRAAMTALATASALSTAAVLVAPHETRAWLGQVLFRLDRTGPIDRPGNQSLAGVLARLYDSGTAPLLLWFAFALLLVAVGMIRARTAHAEGDEIVAFTLVGLTSAIVGPVTDTYELIWVLPAMLILVDVAARRRGETRRPRTVDHRAGWGTALAAGLAYLLFLTDPGWTGGIGANAHAIAVILLVNALPWRPGVAPALPVYRLAAPSRPIPPARRPTGS